MLERWIKRVAVPHLLLLFLLGCESGQGDSADGKSAALTPYDPATFPLATHLNEEYKDDLAGLLKKRRIRVLTTFNKTNFFITGSRLRGFEYSLLRDYGKSLNERMGSKGLKVVMEFIPVPRDQLIPRLIRGLGDIAAAGLTVTPERQQQVDFTDPYLKDVAEVVVTNRRTREIRTLEDLSGLRDRYFADERINERNRIRFSLAAYNAGPTKIQKAQRAAEQMGLDRYRWFRNVEIATLRIVGQETVESVSNINKYFVLFKLQEETEKLRKSNKKRSLAKLSDS